MIQSKYMPPYLRALFFAAAAFTLVHLSFEHFAKSDISAAALFSAIAVGIAALLRQMFQQWLDVSKSTWAAVHQYYTDGDTPAHVKYREEIHAGNTENASHFCNYFEKWGRLTRMGYLPIEIFGGSSGAAISRLLVPLVPFIVEMRGKDNPFYAESYVWIVSECLRRGHLDAVQDKPKVEAAVAILAPPKDRRL